MFTQGLLLAFGLIAGIVVVRLVFAGFGAVGDGWDRLIDYIHTPQGPARALRKRDRALRAMPIEELKALVDRQDQEFEDKLKRFSAEDVALATGIRNARSIRDLPPTHEMIVLRARNQEASMEAAMLRRAEAQRRWADDATTPRSSGARQVAQQ